MTATAKTSVALGREELAWARDRAEREGKSLSAVVTEALRHQRLLEAWAELRDELLGGQPPFTDVEQRAMDEELFGNDAKGRREARPRGKRRASKVRKKR